MKKILVFLSLTFIIIFSAFADNYKVTIDLTRVVDDRVKVQITLPAVNSETILYCIPKIVPGTYSIYDFGRFIYEFTAFDKYGNKLKFEPVDVNQYKIFNATQLSRIEYWVDDSFDMTMENPVFEPSGTNIQIGENFLVNTFGIIGYLDGMKENDFELTIKKPDNFYGSTPLKSKFSDASSDMFYLDNYDNLADSPIMYAVADTAIKQVGGAEVLIGIYSPNNLITAKQIMDNVSEILEAQELYLGGELPVDKYAFIFYFTDSAGVSGSFGALEHKNSSVYYLPETTIEEIAPMLRNVCAHEFFHIVTPLTIHSTEISDFDFIQPDMSKHLWLYEGQTEYAAHHAQVKAGLISTEEFLSRMQEKIKTSTNYYIDTLPFTIMSENCLETYKEQYGNVYEKGALINMCLDIELRRLSKGKYGTQELMKDLGKAYGASTAFEDDVLFDKIATLTYPEIRQFFAMYVEGNKPIPYDKYFAKAGIIQAPVQYQKVITLGNISMDYDFRENERKIIISGLEGSNDFAKQIGYKLGDRFISINNISMTDENAENAIDIWKEQTKAGDKVIIVMERIMDNGKVKKIKLKGKAMEIEIQKPRALIVDLNATPEQVKLRKDWINN